MIIIFIEFIFFEEVLSPLSVEQVMEDLRYLIIKRYNIQIPKINKWWGKHSF